MDNIPILVQKNDEGDAESFIQRFYENIMLAGGVMVECLTRQNERLGVFDSFLGQTKDINLQ